ncbi:MAG: type II secretion system F family protein [bacterium]
MKVYNYEAYTKTGEKVSGELEAGSKQDVVTILQNQSLIIVHVAEGQKFSLSKLTSFSFGGIGLSDRVIFMKQFSTMVSAGLPITEALETLSSQIKSSTLKSILSRILKEVKSGSSLTNAFKKNAGIFDPIQINLIEAGEKSGKLIEIIAKISKDLDQRKNFVGKVKGAMIYPIIIFILIIVIMVVLMVTMVPAVETLFKGFKAEVPWITKAMIAVSNFLNPTRSIGSILIIIFVVAFIIGFRYYRATPSGRKITDKIILRVPVFGKITSLLNTEEFCRILSMLMQSGVPIIESLRIVAGAMNNVIFRESVMNMIPQIEKGFPLAAPMLRDGVFPQILTRMVGTGEQTGKLDKVLTDMGKYYEDELDAITSNLTKLMEPVILLVVGFFVGLMAIAIYLPIYQLATVVK